MSKALNAPLDFLPVTRFPAMDERLDSLHEMMVENQKERDVIQAQVIKETIHIRIHIAKLKVSAACV
jgi:hypothetical protein